jgi:hypothetical protein
LRKISTGFFFVVVSVVSVAVVASVDVEEDCCNVVLVLVDRLAAAAAAAEAPPPPPRWTVDNREQVLPLPPAPPTGPTQRLAAAVVKADADVVVARQHSHIERAPGWILMLTLLPVLTPRAARFVTTNNNDDDDDMQGG